MSKQHYNHNYFYKPVLGRYVEPDCIGLEGRLNPYIYVDLYPINSIDVTVLTARVVNDYWVDDGSNFYTATGGSFTDRLSDNFASDVATLAPLPKFSWLSKFDNLLFKPQYDTIIDTTATTLGKSERLTKPWIISRPKLVTPSLPPAIANKNILGSQILQWGKGIEGAAIQAKGFTEPMAKQWRAFYTNEFMRNVNNTTAQNRVQLMNRIIHLMGEIK